MHVRMGERHMVGPSESGSRARIPRAGAEGLIMSMEDFSASIADDEGEPCLYCQRLTCFHINGDRYCLDHYVDGVRATVTMIVHARGAPPELVDSMTAMVLRGVHEFLMAPNTPPGARFFGGTGNPMEGVPCDVCEDPSTGHVQVMDPEGGTYTMAYFCNDHERDAIYIKGMWFLTEEIGMPWDRAHAHMTQFLTAMGNDT